MLPSIISKVVLFSFAYSFWPLAKYLQGKKGKKELKGKYPRSLLKRLLKGLWENSKEIETKTKTRVGGNLFTLVSDLNHCVQFLFERIRNVCCWAFICVCLFFFHQTNVPFFPWRLATSTAINFVVFFPGLRLFHGLGHGAEKRLWKPECHDARDNSHDTKND